MKYIRLYLLLFFIEHMFQQSENDLQTSLQHKQRELLELKRRKLELELAATTKQLAAQTNAPVSDQLVVPATATPTSVTVAVPVTLNNPMPEALLNADSVLPMMPLPALNVSVSLIRLFQSHFFQYF